MLTAQEVLDTYFLDARCELLELAATLDRLDLADGGTGRGLQDEGLQQIYEALQLLAERETSPDRAERLLNLFSDR
jgi:hypothetical protein